MADYNTLITDEELLAFAEGLKYKTNTLAGQLFPDEKTDSLEATWYDISDGSDLPVMAQVHGWDTEANIASRKPLQRVEIQKMMVKEKIDQSEKLQNLLRNGVTKAEKQIEFLFNDFDRLAHDVYARFDVMRCQLLTSGTITVKENNLDYVVDYNVPAEHKVGYDWTNPTHDILSDIQAMVDVAEDDGKTINKAFTSPGILRILLANEGINKAANGASGLGILLTKEKLNTVFEQTFGFTVEVDKSKYQYQTAAGTFNTLPYFEANKFVLASLGSNGTLGKTLFGETPEEFAASRSGAEYFKNNVYMCQEQLWDPATLWMKATALGIPALRDSRSLVIGTITGVPLP